MQLSQVKNFIQVVEHRSFSRAAAVVRIAQPALSRQMKLLEAELGTPLLSRHSWGVTTTEAGSAFLEHARRIVREVEAARGAVSAAQAEPTGRLVFGAPAPLAIATFPYLASEFLTHYPRVRLQLKAGSSAFVHHGMVTGEFDLAVLYEERGAGQFHATPLLEEDIVLVGPPGKLSPGRKVSLEDLADLPFVLAASPTLLRRKIDSVLLERGVNLRLVLEVDMFPALVGVMSSHEVYTLLPLSGAQTAMADAGLSWCRLRGMKLTRTLVLGRPIGRSPTAATEAMERKVREFVLNRAPTARWRPLFAA